jgi:ribosomal protein S6--L-glutamate ligase
MNLLVLKSNASGWHVDDLRRAARSRGHRLGAMSWRDLSGGVGIDRATPFDGVDAVLLRNMPGGTLEQIVFRMDRLARVAASGKLVVNPPRTIEIAVDKYLALSRMAAAGLPVPPTIVCQRLDEAIRAFDDLGGDVVIKPLFGSEGRGITRVRDCTAATTTFEALEADGRVIYLQRFIDHGNRDLRVFIVGGRVVAAMRRVSDDWITNIARGGRGERYEPSDALCDLAVRAAAACECDVAGVDIVIDQQQQPHLLEVNAAPGWRALSEVSGIDIAVAIINLIEHRHDQRTMLTTGVRLGCAGT